MTTLQKSQLAALEHAIVLVKGGGRLLQLLVKNPVIKKTKEKKKK